MDAIELAKLFHETYEKLAPTFGYETRKETRNLDLGSNNGKLMVAVCEYILPILFETDEIIELEADLNHLKGELEECECENNELKVDLDSLIERNRELEEGVE